jgi:hypothetical protein
MRIREREREQRFSLTKLQLPVDSRSYTLDYFKQNFLTEVVPKRRCGYAELQVRKTPETIASSRKCGDPERVQGERR